MDPHNHGAEPAAIPDQVVYPTVYPPQEHGAQTAHPPNHRVQPVAHSFPGQSTGNGLTQIETLIESPTCSRMLPLTCSEPQTEVKDERISLQKRTWTLEKETFTQIHTYQCKNIRIMNNQVNMKLLTKRK